MQLALSDEDAKFSRRVAHVLTTEIPAEIGTGPAPTSSIWPDDIVTTMRILNKAGLAVPNWPVEWKGRQGLVTAAAAAVGRRDAAGLRARTAGIQCQHGRAGDRPVRVAGDQGTSCRRRPTSTSGGARAFSEPEAGSDLASLRTVAVRDGDDYVINGRRPGPRWVSSPTGSSCWPHESDAPKKLEAGISFILVEMSTPGITLRPIKLIDGSYEVNEVFFEDVRVPANQLVGENQGWSYAKFLLSTSAPGSPASAPPRCGCPTSRSAPPRPPSATGPCWRTRCSPRVAEIENELLALELTQLRVSGDGAPASRTRRHRS